MEYSYWEWVGPQQAILDVREEYFKGRREFYAKVADLCDATKDHIPDGVEWCKEECAIVESPVGFGGRELLNGLMVNSEHEKEMRAQYDQKKWKRAKCDGRDSYTPKMNRKPGTTVRRSWDSTHCRSIKSFLLELAGLKNGSVLRGGWIAFPGVAAHKQSDETWRVVYRVPVGDSALALDPSLLRELTYTQFVEAQSTA